MFHAFGMVKQQQKGRMRDGQIVAKMKRDQEHIMCSFQKICVLANGFHVYTILHDPKHFNLDYP